MRENLLGYLMGALDEAEHAEVQAALQADPRLAAQCAHLEQTIAPLSEDESWIDPPPRLAERTTAFVGAVARREAPTAQRRRLRSELPVDDAAPSRSQPAVPTPATRLPTPAQIDAPPRRWRIADMVVAGGICAAAAMLLFPAIANSRQQAAMAQCQNNLRHIGAALVSYSQDNCDEFPLVPLSGKLGVAGVYAPILKEQGRVENDKVFVCPGSALAEEADDFHVPSTDEVLQQEGKELTASQRRMGGSYGYAFGYENEDKQYCANANHHRQYFALLADSPSLHLKDRQSANHGGGGQNVLFEDGRVKYLKCCRAGEGADNLFLSDRGYVEAGRHYNDSVIGNSWARPVLSRYLHSRK